MRFLHLADLHFRHDAYREAAGSVAACIAAHKECPFDLFVIAGDTWDGPIQNTAGAHFADFVGLLRDLADCAPVAMIYGTPSHDADGSLEVFEHVHARHPIEVLRPGFAYGLSDRGGIHDLRSEMLPQGTSLRAMLFGVPEPNKKWLLAGGATGKEATDEAVRTAMTRLFLGLGGLRAQHDDLPCVLMYHGGVSGAKSATGYTVEAGQGIAVTKDDLAAVGADYIALGHIHEPQVIPGTCAYYPGSAYPCTWGETHKAGANVVYIGNDEWTPTHGDELFSDHSENGSRVVEVSRVDFPHPQRTKITRQGERADVAGKLAWYEITCTKEEAAGIDTDEELAKMLAAGALPGSRVTLNILPTETVRAGEIVTTTALAYKVRLWAENSALTLRPEAYEKAGAMEREAVASGAAVSGAHIRLDRLTLHGAIGIWKKSRKDEITLDLSSASGVAALVGANGAGKTTIIENCHPWPSMLTRDGTLKSHFRLQDSRRELHFTDLRTGWKYRAQIEINAATASGGTEYWLHVDKGMGLVPVDGINGRLEPYEAAIASLFGSLEMYLRTAFVTQRPTKYAPDLGEATKGERKALFAELAGIDYLEAHRARAKAEADTLDTEAAHLAWIVADREGAAAQEAEATEGARIEEEAAADARAEADRLEERGRAMNEGVNALRLAREEAARKAARIEDAERERATCGAAIETARRVIESYQASVNARAEADKELAEIAALESEASNLRAAKQAIDERNAKAVDAYQEAFRAAANRQGRARSGIEFATSAREKVGQTLARMEGRKAAPIVDTCPTCGQLLPEDKRAHLAEEAARLDAEIESLRKELAIADEGIAGLRAEYETIAMPAAPMKEPFHGAARFAEIEGDLAFRDEAAARKTLRDADEAAVRIEGEREKIKAAQGKQATLSAEIAEAGDVVMALRSATAAMVQADAELDETRRAYSDARASMARHAATAEAFNKAASTARLRIAERIDALEKLDTLEAEKNDWRALERAFGPDGIQALELDALAPSIAAVANRLLEDAYGPRYRIEFRTTRIAGKGGKAKQVEDFEIFVLDNEDASEQEIATLSGGESVWIRKALYDAFAIIRAQNAGTKFLTAFLDEADGALDPGARMQYLRMLQSAHRESGRALTVIITHSTELQAMVDTVIDVGTLGLSA